MFPSWLIIAIIAIAVAWGINRLPGADIRWFFRLRRPRWLTFEWAIPWIWIFIFICGGWSAYNVWETNPENSQSWWLMAGYLLLEMLIMSYTPIMCKMRSLTVGTIIGAIGFIWGLILAVIVIQVSIWGFILLLPYLLWSPIGTYVTWKMIPLNPGAA